MKKMPLQSGNPSTAQRPNVVFLIADDHSFSAIRAYGNQQVQTPSLDRLAQQGTMFQSTYIMGAQTAAVCVPSRACLHTGANIYRALISDQVCLEDHEDKQQWSIHPQLPTMPEAFRKAGYETYGIGKWHNGTESFNRSFSGGSQLFFGGMSEHTGMRLHAYDLNGRYADKDASVHSGFSTDLFADAAVEFIEQYEQEEPFFLYVAFTAPHDPRTPPDEYQAKYMPREIVLPANCAERHPFDNGELKIRDEMISPAPRRPEEIQQQIADYYAMITHMDAKIGQILLALEQQGFGDNTLVVYTSDHGLAIGQHGLMGKQNLYEHSIRIPLMVKGPGIPSQIVNALSCQMDIFPTLCELAGIARPQTAEGRSLASLITGEKQQVRDSVFAVYKDVQRMASDGRWKLIQYYRSVGRNVGTDRMQLFDLRNDPLEMNDLSSDDAFLPELKRMAAILQQRQSEIGDPLCGGNGRGGF